jgi:hypothetical protein
MMSQEIEDEGFEYPDAPPPRRNNLTTQDKLGMLVIALVALNFAIATLFGLIDEVRYLASLL